MGSSLRTLTELIKETGARAVLANALYEPWLKERDDVVVSALQKVGVQCRMFHSYCLRDPYSVSTEGVGLRGKLQSGWPRCTDGLESSKPKCTVAIFDNICLFIVM